MREPEYVYMRLTLCLMTDRRHPRCCHGDEYLAVDTGSPISFSAHSSKWGPQHGYGISRAMQSQSGDILPVDTGSFYPALRRLERKKWIAADWKTSENKQRVRVYRLTAKGRTQLADERSRWDQLSCAIAGILNAPKKEFET